MSGRGGFNERDLHLECDDVHKTLVGEGYPEYPEIVGGGDDSRELVQDAENKGRWARWDVV